MTQGRTALVVFGGPAQLWWQRALRRGFRHCFLVLAAGEERILFDPLSHRTEIHALTVPPGFDLAGHYRAHGYTVVETTVRRVDGAAPWLPLTCVEAVKRVLGVRSWRVWTPYRLYRHLMKENDHMGGFFGSPPPPPPPPPPPAPSFEDASVEEQRRKARLAAARRKGRRSTILTGGLGDTSPPPIQRKTLLGQ